jgi:hypothetical protein
MYISFQSCKVLFETPCNSEQKMSKITAHVCSLIGNGSMRLRVPDWHARLHAAALPVKTWGIPSISAFPVQHPVRSREITHHATVHDWLACQFESPLHKVSKTTRRRHDIGTEVQSVPQALLTLLVVLTHVQSVTKTVLPLLVVLTQVQSVTRQYCHCLLFWLRYSLLLRQ